jgi:putative IMPACT (imprinted ancient) family translation regulator
MLEVLRGHEVSDVVAVVTRWFGGVLLGAGGLVRAYGDAVRAGLEAAGTLQRELLTEHLLEVSHADAARLETELRIRGVQIIGSEYAATVTTRLGVGPGAAPHLAGWVAELTGGSARLTPCGQSWTDRP